MGYRVDNIPLLVRPFYLATGWAIGILFYSYYALRRITSKITIEGPGNHDLSQHAVFCVWHESWWPWFIVFLRFKSKNAAINHPAAYMLPVHVVLKLMGLKKLILGSSGEEGRKAAIELAQLVREGYSTAISPDGPYGPPHVLKKGVFHIAQQSGVPIVPLTITSARYIPVKSWDSKKFPLPFNHLKVVVHEPIHVGENMLEAAEKVTKALGA